MLYKINSEFIASEVELELQDKPQPARASETLRDSETHNNRRWV